MQGFGFDVTDTPFYYKDRVLATFRDYTKGTLITLFYAWYYSESIKADGMLKDLSGRCPEFIKLIDEIHNNRGHSGKMDFKRIKTSILLNSISITLSIVCWISCLSMVFCSFFRIEKYGTMLYLSIRRNAKWQKVKAKMGILQ